MKMTRVRDIALTAAMAVLIGFTAVPASAKPLCDKFGFAGLLAKCNREKLPKVTLSAGKPLTEKPFKLQSGVYYTMYIESDGSQELALVGPEFFRAIWINEIVVNDLEIRAMALDSFEFDDEGTIRFTFIAIKPGRYEMKIPGSTGESQRIAITIE